MNDKIFVVTCTYVADYYPEQYTVSIHKTRLGAETKITELKNTPNDPNQMPMNEEYSISEEDLLD